jgi:GNAT superfamily N-acetyltransferase
LNITYTDAITAAEANAVRKAVGFRQIHPEQLQADLDASTRIWAARAEGQAVGMARLQWNGGAGALIQDLLVVPAYRTRGIEQEMVTRVLDFLRAQLKPGFGIQLDVRAWEGQELFYEGFGFQVSTPQRRGLPMHICLTDQIELTDEMFQQDTREATGVRA